MILSSTCCCYSLAEMPFVGGQSGKPEICDVCVSVGGLCLWRDEERKGERGTSLCFDLESSSANKV